MTEPLDVRTASGVCRVTFRRPEALNALDEATASGLVAALTSAATDDEVRVVVVTGEGAAFSAGADLTGDDPVKSFDVRTMEGANAIIRAIVGSPKPVVAAVNGIAAGVGASICFAADLAVARESASFLLAFSRVGLMPDGGASLTVAASAGRAKAMRMALLAEPLSAREAYDAGLISHLTADDELDATVDALVRRLAAGPPIAFAATKKAVNAATLGGLEAALERERTGQVVLFGTEDAAEGMRAFVEKRRPTFTGS
jgi:enoyl-CoA hydratase